MSVIFLEDKMRKVAEQESRVRKSVFRHWEAERKRMADVLQEDIAQLVAIAKIKLSESNAVDVDNCLAMALKQLNRLSFEMKPQILEHFGLAAALQELIAHNVSAAADYSITHVTELPEDMDPLMEAAIFRLIQDVLGNLLSLKLRALNFEINREDECIAIKSLITVDSFNGEASSRLTEQALTKNIVHIMYLFDAEATFLFHNDYKVEMTIHLNEKHLH
ncbi:hypothetical protein [Mucilaginibacter sp. PAMB04168]|uniref:hypothetical protein n=1 Tax=Mucilaginibacter sp. PAMB04168 TaxID=3138567 RepID=UPI0031F63D31